MAMALHFLSGRNKGKEFLLPEGGEFVIIRSPDDDVSLDEDRTGIPHAKIIVKVDKFVLKDLQTGPGTFVNRKSVTETTLSEGDRIRVGKVTFMLIGVASSGKKTSEAEDESGSAAQGGASGKKRLTLGSSISGMVKDVSLIDILQFLANYQKSGDLTITSTLGTGHIYLQDGQVVSAVIDVLPGCSALKVLYRLLDWKTGSFTFGPAPAGKMPNDFGESTQSILLEAAHQIDALNELLGRLPKTAGSLGVVVLTAPQLRKLTAAETHVFGLVRQFGAVNAVLDNHPEMDLEVCRILLALIERKLVVRI
jgi:hypothetical protein